MQLDLATRVDIETCVGRILDVGGAYESRARPVWSVR